MSVCQSVRPVAQFFPPTKYFFFLFSIFFFFIMEKGYGYRHAKKHSLVTLTANNAYI